MHLVHSRSGFDEVCGYTTHYYTALLPVCLAITHMINAINQFSNKSTLSDRIQEGLSSIFIKLLVNEFTTYLYSTIYYINPLHQVSLLSLL